MDPLTTEELRTLCLAYGKCCYTDTKSQAAQLDALVEVTKECLRMKAHRLVRQAGGHPVLCTYQGDGTPLRTSMKRFFVKGFGADSHGPSAGRSGGQSAEVYSERAYYKCLKDPSNPMVAVMLKQSRPFGERKVAWNCFKAFEDFARSLRQMGCAGIAITHTCFDKANYQSLANMIDQQHAEYHKSRIGTLPEADVMHHALQDLS